MTRGLAFNQSNTFDNNQDGCMRINEAWSAQLGTNQDWADGEQNSFFKGCTGARLADMAAPTFGQNQMSKLQSPDVVFMQVGGNDAGFYNVALNCIYQFDPSAPLKTDYDCDGAIKGATDYLNGAFTSQLTATWDDVFKSKAANTGKDFHLYQIGYAHFFNLGDEGAWCNEESFGVTHLNQPKLTQAVRQRINDLTTLLNGKMQSAAGGYRAQNPDKQHVGFIDVSWGFDGHRFCEAAHAPGNEGCKCCTGYAGQYYNMDVWFWNLSPAVIAPGSCPPGLPTDGTSAKPDTPLFDSSAPEATTLSSGPDGQGSALRPFHPKDGGHTAIMKAIIQQLMRDAVPGVKNPHIQQAVQSVDFTLVTPSPKVIAGPPGKRRRRRNVEPAPPQPGDFVRNPLK
ncbi:MAG: hypothetical protein M1831_001976 [Alyxoria varia]|nr:MAG: hypothetical protein M1831_001976 [Alyxoria varia]